MSDVTFTDSYKTDDAIDRRTALNAAVTTLQDDGSPLFHNHHANEVVHLADAYYRWLRDRDSLNISLSIEAGQPSEQTKE